VEDVGASARLEITRAISAGKDRSAVASHLAASRYLADDSLATAIFLAIRLGGALHQAAHDRVSRR